MNEIVAKELIEQIAEDAAGAHPMFRDAPRTVEFNKLRKRLIRLTREALEKFGASKNFTFHRYPDTRSGSRGKVVHVVAAQPSDFLVSQLRQSKVPGIAGLPVAQAWHVEAKATTKGKLTHKTLRQYGMLKKWWWAGIEPIVLVHRLETDDWVVLRAYRLFPGQDPFVFNDEPAPRSFDFEGLYPYLTAEAALRDVFNIKEKK